MKNSSNTIWNRTSYLPICSTAPTAVPWVTSGVSKILLIRIRSLLVHDLTLLSR